MCKTYLKKLKRTNLDARQKTYLGIIESNLNDIISPFVCGVSMNFLSFTPAEIQVASLIKQGKTTKAIAEILNLSPRTIDRLLSAHDHHAQAILVPSWRGRHGHPVLFPWPLGQEVFRLGDQEGVNLLLRRHANREIECSEDEFPDDLDTPEDYRRLRQRERPS